MARQHPRARTARLLDSERSASWRGAWRTWTRSPLAGGAGRSLLWRAEPDHRDGRGQMVRRRAGQRGGIMRGVVGWLPRRHRHGRDSSKRTQATDVVCAGAASLVPRRPDHRRDERRRGENNEESRGSHEQFRSTSHEGSQPGGSVPSMARQGDKSRPRQRRMDRHGRPVRRDHLRQGEDPRLVRTKSKSCARRRAVSPR